MDPAGLTRKHQIPQTEVSHPRELCLIPAGAPHSQRLESILTPPRNEMQGAGYIPWHPAGFRAHHVTCTA